jgi:hypothetical protein
MDTPRVSKIWLVVFGWRLIVIYLNQNAKVPNAVVILTAVFAL